ncbi:MAG: hypothetical protein MUD08_00765 [Cytophagales bacterium]|jgi:hypothetical protein|nr:hypothetical protein [Cytophagales bacterium]
MKQLRHLFLLTVLAVAAFSCNRDDDDPAPQVDPKVRLLARTWRTTAWTINPPLPQQNGTPITNVYAAVPACLQDDIYIFQTDFSYSIEEGATKCNPQIDPQVFVKGTWSFSLDQGTLVLTNNPLELDNPLRGLANWTIQELTETTLRVTYPFITTDDDGRITGTYTLTRTFTAQ